MSANAKYARLSVTVNVTGGTLTIGIKEPSSDTTWLVWDNFTLTCNSIATGIRRPTPDPSRNGGERAGAVFDLSGRKMVNSPLWGAGVPSTVNFPKGVYIVNGKKVVIK